MEAKQFKIVCNQFATPIYAGQITAIDPPFTPDPAKAFVYDQRDWLEGKLLFFRTIAQSIGLDPTTVTLEECAV